MPKTCFVVSPIGNQGSNTRIHADKVLNHIINPICSKHNLEVLRSDQIMRTSVITDDIYTQLSTSNLVIVDITELNPNVFLELGFRIATKKPYIIIKDKDYSEKYPFDISATRILEYSLDIDNIDCSKKYLDEYISNIDFSENVIFSYTSLSNQGLKFVDEGENGYSLR